jgi:hypothetical protein
MNWLLIVGILIFSTMPLYAQRQEQNVAKLKADARNLVCIIGSDKTKTQTYCQIYDLSEQLLRAVQEEDRKKAKALAERIAELNKKMGPEFAALINIEEHVDLDSRDGQEIASIVATLGESCPHSPRSPRSSIADEMREEHRRRVARRMTSKSRCESARRRCELLRWLDRGGEARRLKPATIFATELLRTARYQMT